MNVKRTVSLVLPPVLILLSGVFVAAAGGVQWGTFEAGIISLLSIVFAAVSVVVLLNY